MKIGVVVEVGRSHFIDSKHTHFKSRTRQALGKIADRSRSMFKFLLLLV